MSKQTINYALHNPGAWPGSRADGDEVIALRGDVAELRARLDAANERARGMAGDLSTLAQENAAQAAIISKLSHSNDELRYQLRLAAREGGGLLTLTDRGDGADGYGVMPNE